MKEKCIFSKCKWFLVALCIVFVQYACSPTVAKAEEYPEIIPENLTCSYGYDYLGTLENGETLQKFYEYVDELAWEFYCSDEEITNIEESDVIGDITFYDYYAVSADIDDMFTPEEVSVIHDNWDVFFDCFTNDTPIYYYMRAGFGAHMRVDLENVLTIEAVYYANGDTGEWLEEFVSVENRMAYRTLIEEKLHEYYDLTKDLETDYEKELAIYRKLLTEVDYSHEDLYNLYSHSVIGAFTGTKTVCDGYAQAFQLICNYCGIDCIWVNGKAQDDTHAWNGIKLDDEWYCVDATWGDEEAIRDNEQYWHSSTFEMADIAYTEFFLNMPISAFNTTHKTATLEDEDTAMEYPEFSDDSKFWSAHVMNEPAETFMEGTITYAQIQEACEYICQQMEGGITRIDLYAWDSYIVDVETEQGGLLDIVQRTIRDFVSSTGETYTLAYGYSFGSWGVKNGTANNILMCMSIILTQEVSGSDGVQYNIHNIDGSGSGIMLKKYPVTEERAYLPDAIDGEEVRALNLRIENAKQLIIPDSVRILQFSGDTLEQVVVPETVRDIYSFPDVTSVYLPKSVKVINTNVVLVDKIFGYAGTYPEVHAELNHIEFYDLTGKDLIDTIVLDNVTLPKNGENIIDVLGSYETDSDQYIITDITVETEDELAVSGTEYTVSLSVNAKGNYAITPNTLVDVNGDNASIQNVDMDEAVIKFTFMPEQLDYFTWSVHENTVIIDGVTESGLTATELVIPNTIADLPVVEIAPGAFKDCDSLESISFEAENDYYVIDNGVIYSKDRKVLHSVTAAYPKRNFETPWDVVEIEAWAFANRDLPVLRIDNVKKIGANAFNGCTVTSMYFSRSVEEIDEGAFRNMEHLDMSVIELIGFSIESASEHFIINNGMIMEKDGSRILIQIYKQDTTTEVRVPGSVTEIDAYAFEECPNLEIIRIPASVTYIGEDAFVNCDNLTIITPEDSYAAEYAEEQGFELIEIDTTADVEGVELNEENFPDKVFRNAVSDSFDFDWNGVLSEDEIANAKVFTKITAGIESLKGVEYLTELEELTVYMNKMWTLDLSANTKLQNHNLSMQETKTGELKGTLGESATVILTEFLLNPFSENKLLGYEDEKGNGTLYIRTSLPADLYGEGEEVIWYSRRESCGMGSDMSLVDEEGYRYFQVDTTDATTYVYGAILLDGEVAPEDIMPELSELSDGYFVELVVIDEWDEYGRPVLASATAIADAKYSLKDMTATVDHKVTNYYTIDLAQLVGEENAKNIVSVENGVLDGSVATLIPVDFMVHEIRPTLSVSYQYDTTGYGLTMGVKFTFEGLVSVDDCTEVPDGFAAEFDSVDDLKDHIHKDMHKGDNKHHKHQHMFDAKLWSVNDNCEWYNIAPEDFPAEGVEVFMPYPEGTGKDTDFKIAHVFEHACNGFEKGHIEYPEIKKEEHGIRFRVMGLSPIMLAYGEETATEPADDVTSFVTRLYDVILERTPDESGLNSWVSQLTSGTKTGVDVTEGFILSKEFIEKDLTDEAFVQTMYRAFFDRDADDEGLATWLGYLEQGYVKEYIFARFAGSDEFADLCADYGITRGNVEMSLSVQTPHATEQEFKVWQFVERYYDEFLGRDADYGGLKGWADKLLAGTITGVEAAEGFFLSEEFQNADLDAVDFVNTLYRAFFNRPADEGGLEKWTGFLADGYKTKYIFGGLAVSDEFEDLCESYGISRGEVYLTFAEQTNDLTDREFNVWQFVERLYVEVLDRKPDYDGLVGWANDLLNDVKSGAEVAEGFILSKEFLEKDMTNEEFVRIMYKAFFGREADTAGLNSWLDRMANGETEEQVFAGFVNSEEFGDLCEVYGIDSGSKAE